MRKIYILLAALVVLFFGCDDKSQEVAYTSDLVEVIQNIAGVPAEGLTKEITFTTAAAWRSETEDEWVTISPDRGPAGENTITITVDRSEQEEPRSILVRFTENGQNHDIVVSQQSGTPIDRKVVVEQLTIQNGSAVFTPVESIIFNMDQYNNVAGYMLRIKANFDWIIDASTIPSIFKKLSFINKDDKPYSADKNVFTPDFTIELDQAKLTTEPQSVQVAVKDKLTGDKLWIPISVPGLGDNYITVLWTPSFDGRVELQRVGGKAVTFELAQSPTFDYRFVALERLYSADQDSYLTTLTEVNWVLFGKPQSRAALIKTAHTISAVDNATDADRLSEIFLLPNNVTVSESIELNNSGVATVKSAYLGRVYQLGINVTQYGPNAPVQFSFDNNLTTKAVQYSGAATIVPEGGNGNIVKYNSNYENRGSEVKPGLYLKINPADTTGWNCSIGFSFDRSANATPCIEIVLDENRGPARTTPVEVWVRYKDLTATKIGELTVTQTKK